MQRDLYLDNFKIILIFFVVLGHFMELNKSHPVMGGINNVIYSFHMPLFIFISGYFSKSINSQRKKDINTLIYSYIIFEILNLVFTKITSLGSGSFNIFIPTYSNWYLLGLFFWRLLIPYFSFYERKTSLFLVIVFAFFIGFFDDFNQFLGLYRIFYFMPFFVLGFYCKNIHSLINKWLKYRIPIITILIISILFILIISIWEPIPTLREGIGWAYTPYRGYGTDGILALLLRLIGFTSSLLICFSFLFIVPQKRTFFSKYGKNTLNVFLLHMFIVYPMNSLVLEHNSPGWILSGVYILASAIITIFFSLSFVDKIISPLTNANKLFEGWGKLKKGTNV
jgi:fucose 4-O-acetylase-like acetyltransferase